jgi:hypothetical protein
MIRPPSLIKQYSEFWSEDAAFEQAPSEDASDDAKKEYAAKLTAAWDTGDWSPLRIAGSAEPTTFLMRPLPSDICGLLGDMQSSGAGNNELFTLAFRAALVGISNLDGAKLKMEEDERLGRIASLSWMDDVGLTGQPGLRLINEIGIRVVRRASSLSPKR